MPKHLIRGLTLVVAGLLTAGCASSDGGGGLSVRSYIDDKPRVDQNMKGGNQGYLTGTPKELDRSQYSKTRQIYVTEFTKEAPEFGDNKSGGAAEPVVTQPRVSSVDEDFPSSVSERSSGSRQAIVIPSLDDEPSVYSRSSSNVVDRSSDGNDISDNATEVEYTIQKSDTLQKISKKFYNTYSKWQRIYDYNKAVISDPNRIKVGTVIRIPAE